MSKMEKIPLFVVIANYMILLTAVSVWLSAVPCLGSQERALTRLQRAKYYLSPVVDLTRSPDLVIDKSHFTLKQQQHYDLQGSEEVESQDHGSKENDRISRLPGQPPVEFSQFGGYVTVDKAAGRAFYYYFVEAPEKRKKSLPLLLWLNGGPGCSSLAYGAMQELGPFRVHSDGKTLYRNKYSWNNGANVLFVESPAGVGFSYSNSSKDYQVNGDWQTASDNYAFLVNWFERFPEYKGRDFYISGESYAGHYVPQLAKTIIDHHMNNSKVINLKGIMIGNAVINDETDERGMYDYLETHALVSTQVGATIRNKCNFSPSATSQSTDCIAAANEVEKNTYYIDIYNIYAPICTTSALTVRPKKATVNSFDPCSDNYVYAYLNRPEVQKAMHANVTRLNYDWEPCSDVIMSWNNSASTVIPLLKEFMAKGMRVWVFSGDIDGRVPVTSTQYSVETMKLTVKTAWHAWFVGGEVGGYTQVYDGDLTLATVRAAGHQVPSYQPRRALSLISHFILGTPLPDTTRYN